MSAFLGIEFGSTRIKAALIDETFNTLASGSHEWENKFVDGLWTYDLDAVWTGLQDSVGALSDDLRRRSGQPLGKVDAIGVSAMMHGYLAFDREGKLLVPFRTWRNTSTEAAAKALSEQFHYNIPQRWSVAHLYQAILNGEPHAQDICFLTTLAGYVHWRLTGRKVVGIGDASGIFPVDSATRTYNAPMAKRFDELVGAAGGGRIGWKLLDLLPEALNAGEDAGRLTEEGAGLLDPSGGLRPGIPLCPPEGDAGTGMVATNSVAERTGNVSAGTSIFAMVVLEKELSGVYPEIDLVTTPAGKPAAMVHCNNCAGDIDAWLRLFHETLQTFGAPVEKSALYDALYGKALEGEADGGGLLAYNYYGGEPITALDQGRPLLVRTPDSSLTLANFMRTLLYSAMATLKIGMDLLTEKEGIRLDLLVGHGGLFKTRGAAQSLLASALQAPVAVMESAGEGGAWGIALLAAYRSLKGAAETLEEFLETRVFARTTGDIMRPRDDDRRGFADFMRRYQEGLAIERAAVEHLPIDLFNNRPGC